MPDEVVVAETPVAPAETPVETPAEQAPADSTGEVKPETVTPEKPPEPKGPSRVERKINRLYREAAEQRARADLLERQLSESKPKPPVEGVPKLEDFPSVEDYAKAVAEHEKTKAIKDYEAKQQTAAQAAQQRALQSAWEAQVAEAEAKYEDFDEVVGDLKPNTPLNIGLMHAKNGVDVAHYLGKNMAEAKRVLALNPIAQFIEIGRLSQKLEANPPQPKKVPEPPAPINPVGGISSKVTKDPSEMSQKEFEAWRKSVIKAR